MADLVPVETVAQSRATVLVRSMLAELVGQGLPASQALAEIRLALVAARAQMRGSDG